MLTIFNLVIISAKAAEGIFYREGIKIFEVKNG